MYSMSIKLYGCSVHPEQLIISYKIVLFFGILSRYIKKYVGIYSYTVSHRIHGAGIYANIWGILMVNVTIYIIHGSYGYYKLCWHL